ncbi:hypothetical protein KSP40_PGU017679 [Platanthera guangdongensis]|uniref:Uncharacterized protein n=1 Tax=Platanthera guangdongensis TaxID=2320717 RepID=A0ABR2MSG1_9ASPA
MERKPLKAMVERQKLRTLVEILQRSVEVMVARVESTVGEVEVVSVGGLRGPAVHGFSRRNQRSWWSNCRRWWNRERWDGRGGGMCWLR